MGISWKDNVSNESVRVQTRVGHGLDSFMDWIGLGRFVRGIAWIGLDWVR